MWQWIDKSLPIVLENKLTRLKLEEPTVWFIRIGVHKVKGKCMDIREFVKKQNEFTVWYEPTDHGIIISIEGWERIIDVLFKLWRKHK